MPNQEQYFLRQNVQVEPLVDQWYAWPHLIPPAPTARNIVHRHFKIMDSYINPPQIHANAVKNPKMLGGSFIDYDGKRVDEIRELREATRCKRAALIELSEADRLAGFHAEIFGKRLQPAFSVSENSAAPRLCGACI